jgi:hypothetical protein
MTPRRAIPARSAIIAFSFNIGAYCAETIRASILAINKGQWDAAFSLGMTKRRTLRRIIAPQSLSIALPPEKCKLTLCQYDNGGRICCFAVPHEGKRDVATATQISRSKTYTIVRRDTYATLKTRLPDALGEKVRCAMIFRLFPKLYSYFTLKS